MAAQMFLQNLQLLGFDTDKHATGVFKKIVVDEHMFFHANNTKAFESTSHFLFAKLDPTRARKEFTKCWPMTETEYWRQSREYRSIAYRWLDELRLKRCLPGQITLRRSYFEDCRGDKVMAIMFALSTYVLQTEVARRTATRLDDNPPIRILGNASINMLPKEQLLAKLKSEIDRMSTAVTESHAVYTSNETWAKVARSMTGISNDARLLPGTSPRYKNSSVNSRSCGVESLLATLNNRLEASKQKNQELKKNSQKKKEQWLSKMGPGNPLPDLYTRLRAPIEVDENKIAYDSPALNLRTSTMEEDIQRVKDYVTEIVSSKMTSKKKRLPEKRVEPVSTKRARTLEIQPIRSPRPTHSEPVQKPKPSPARTTATPSRGSNSSVDQPPEDHQPAEDHQPLGDHSQARSPLSLLSEKVSPVSNSFGNYCDQVVNEMLEQFHDQRTPDKAPTPDENRSPVENRSTRHSFASQPGWYRPSPLSQKVSAQDVAPPPDYDDELDAVYQNSPTRRISPVGSRLPRMSLAARSPAWSSPMTRRLFEQSPAPSPTASSLHAYRAAVEGHSEFGLLDETEPDLFYNSDFTSPA